MAKLIDCFIFYNELELLTYRLNLLNDVADYFVLVESTHTFIGKEKKLYYNENKHLFEKFNNKIIHIIVDDFPYKYSNVNLNETEVWANEHFHRNVITRGLNLINNLSNNDLIVIADLDEIPDPRTLKLIKQEPSIVDIIILQMDMYYYNLNTTFINKWYHCKILTYQTYKESNLTFNNIRLNWSYKVIKNGGWHLSYFGDKYFIQNKIQQFSHQEYNNSEYTNLNNIDEKIQNNKDLFNRSDIDICKIETKDNNYLPLLYETYLQNFYN